MARRSAANLAGAGLAALLAIGSATGAAAGPNEAERLRTLEASEAAFTRAVAAHRRGDLERARAGYREAVSHDPRFVEALVNLARIAVATGELAGAAALLDRAEEARPHYPEIEAVRGLLAFEDGNPAAAVDELSQAVDALPDDLEVLNNLGASLVSQGRVEEAIRVLDRARRLDPTRPTPVFNLALAYDRAGDHVRAGHYYARYLQLSGRRGAMRGPVEARLAVLQGRAAPTPPVAAAAPMIEGAPAPDSNPGFAADAAASNPNEGAAASASGEK